MMHRVSVPDAAVTCARYCRDVDGEEQPAPPADVDLHRRLLAGDERDRLQALRVATEPNAAIYVAPLPMKRATPAAARPDRKAPPPDLCLTHGFGRTRSMDRDQLARTRHHVPPHAPDHRLLAIRLRACLHTSGPTSVVTVSGHVDNS